MCDGFFVFVNLFEFQKRVLNFLLLYNIFCLCKICEIENLLNFYGFCNFVVFYRFLWILFKFDDFLNFWNNYPSEINFWWIWNQFCLCVEISNFDDFWVSCQFQIFESKSICPQSSKFFIFCFSFFMFLRVKKFTKVVNFYNSCYAVILTINQQKFTKVVNFLLAYL